MGEATEVDVDTSPFVLTGLCGGVAEGAADPCHLRDSTWSARALMAAARGDEGLPHLSGWVAAASPVEFYFANMDSHGLLRKAARVPLATALAATTGHHPDWPADDIVSPPRRYIHWSVFNSTAWGALVPPELLSVLPRSLAFSSDWLAGALGSRGEADDPASDWLVTTHWRMLLVGNAGAGMFNHRDQLPTASWQLQLRGSKRWHLCPPAATPAVSIDGDPDSHVGVDMLRPSQAETYERAPRAALAAGCFCDVLRPGEMLVYPPGWWHQTEIASVGEAGSGEGGDSGEGAGAAEEDVAVAVTESIVTRGSWRKLIAAVADNCAKPYRPGITPGRPLCERLGALAAQWRQEFVKNPIN